jgi:chemotaxis protein histidine kinase CheA
MSDNLDAVLHDPTARGQQMRERRGSRSMSLASSVRELDLSHSAPVPMVAPTPTTSVPGLPPKPMRAGSFSAGSFAVSMVADRSHQSKMAALHTQLVESDERREVLAGESDAWSEIQRTATTALTSAFTHVKRLSSEACYKLAALADARPVEGITVGTLERWYARVREQLLSSQDTMATLKKELHAARDEIADLQHTTTQLAERNGALVARAKELDAERIRMEADRSAIAEKLTALEESGRLDLQILRRQQNETVMLLEREIRTLIEQRASADREAARCQNEVQVLFLKRQEAEGVLVHAIEEQHAAVVDELKSQNDSTVSELEARFAQATAKTEVLAARVVQLEKANHDHLAARRELLNRIAVLQSHQEAVAVEASRRIARMRDDQARDKLEKARLRTATNDAATQTADVTALENPTARATGASPSPSPHASFLGLPSPLPSPSPTPFRGTASRPLDTSTSLDRRVVKVREVLSSLRDLHNTSTSGHQHRTP